jgi:RsmE family RNA methyltransferase
MLHTPLAIDELFDYWSTLRENGATGLLFHQQACEHIAQASLHEYLDNVPPLTVLTVGPEGGFSESEVSRFLEAGFRPFTIGGTILRTETAALYCAAITRIVLMERNSWKLNQTKTGSV